MQGTLRNSENRLISVQPALQRVREQSIHGGSVQQPQRPLHPEQCKKQPYLDKTQTGSSGKRGVREDEVQRAHPLNFRRIGKRT